MGKSVKGGSSQKSSSKQQVWDAQAPHLESMYQNTGVRVNDAMNMADRGVAKADVAANNAGNIYDQASGAWSNAMGGNTDIGNLSSQTMPTTANALNSMMSGGASNPFLNQSVANAMGAMTSAFNRDVMPGIRSDAMGSGQMGSSRHGIAEGNAMDSLQKNMLSAATDMYSNAYDQGQNRMLQAANISSGNINNAGNQALNALGQGNMMAGLNLAPMDIYGQAADLTMAPLATQSGILGGPTVLTESRGKSESTGGLGGLLKFNVGL